MHKVLIVYAVFEFGELRQIMSRHNITWSAEELSDKTDFHLETIEGLLTGKRGLRKDDAIFFAKVLGIPFDELFGDVFDK
ncbi:helix-turn-helix transcriptional regulator [candidate division WWE3 bacterium]|nr:helix-turn-helix transcriptional regulator [candidate division WWE3 bacterium]